VNLNSGLDDKEFALEEGPLSECADMEAARFGSALPDQGSIVEEVSHRTWAISTTANCRVSSKTYRLNRAANDVTWANGNGNEDTEQVVSENGRVFETFTRASNHWGSAGEAPGIAWKYVGVNQNRIVVFRNGRHVYDLMACPAG
jgi:hypothetical protein